MEACGSAHHWVSTPMRLYWVMDGSGPGFSQQQFWHAMPWGRPPQQSNTRSNRLIKKVHGTHRYHLTAKIVARFGELKD
jgi:hypothetical protein